MSELVINNNIVNDLLIKQFTNYVFMMIVTDIKGNIIYANKKYCQF
ncbi:PAS domain S-box protein, partial [Proteus sp. G4441]|nr:PAS domain S-box protein [Proteus sp. G4441]